MKDETKIVLTVIEEIEKEISYAIKGNNNVRRDMEESDEMYYTVSGKISALRGLQGFVEEVRAKYLAENENASCEEFAPVSETARKIYDEVLEVISTAEFADCWSRENFKNDIAEVFYPYLDEEDRDDL